MAWTATALRLRLPMLWLQHWYAWALLRALLCLMLLHGVLL